MMKRGVIQKLMTKRYLNQHKLKFQPVNKWMRNTKEVKMSLLKNKHEICECDFKKMVKLVVMTLIQVKNQR